MNTGQMTQKQNNGTMKTLLVCGLLTLSVVTAGWTLASQPLNNHECFIAVTAREMLQSGDWVMPTFNAQPRLQKTPLSYWLVASLAKLTGRVDEFTTRLPNAVFAVLSVAAILYFVSRWLSFRIALLSAGVWATSLAYVRYAHNARPDMIMTFFILLCFLSFYSAVNPANRKRQVVYALVFWVSFGLANIAKGPAPIPIVLVPLFAYVLISGQWKKIPKLLPISGILVFFIIILPWPLAVAHRVNWDLAVWKYEFVDRFFGDYASGNKPIYYYLPQMFMFTIPWAALLPMALAAPFFKVWQDKRPVMLYLWLWFAADLLFLTINAGKRQHYILPLLPATAILTGILLEDMVFLKKAYTPKYARDVLRGHVFVIITAAAALLVYAAWANHRLLAAAAAIALTVMVSAAAVALFFARKRPALGTTAAFAGITAVVMVSYVTLANPFSCNEPSRQFSLEVAQKVPASDELAAYKLVSPRFINYFARPVPKLQSLQEVEKLYRQNCWIVAFGACLDELRQNNGFNTVYEQSNAERHKSNIVAGALFHLGSEPQTDPNLQAP